MPDRATVTPERQHAAWAIAHRILITFLYRKLIELDPREGTRAALDATNAMLRQSVPSCFADRAEPTRSLLIALAQQEIDRIMTVPFRPVGPEDRAD